MYENIKDKFKNEDVTSQIKLVVKQESGESLNIPSLSIDTSSISNLTKIILNKK